MGLVQDAAESLVFRPVLPRGCGVRQPGGVYLECGTSDEGSPIEDFLLCPPIPVEPETFGITPLGVTITEFAGAHHVMDWVGSSHYPNVADFVEETRRQGLSRRIAKTSDFSLLTDKSRIFLLHASAIITNREEFWAALWPGEPEAFVSPTLYGCPRDVPEHVGNRIRLTQKKGDAIPMCAAFWYDDVRGGEDVEDGDDPRDTLRAMPSFTYRARRAPETVITEHQLGIFMSLPIHRIVVVRDAAGGDHEAALDAAAASSLPVDLVEE